jgi:hypothetical protein
MPLLFRLNHLCVIVRTGPHMADAPIPTRAKQRQDSAKLIG